MAPKKTRTQKTRRQNISTTDPVTAYAKAVVARKIVAGPHVRDTCQRHLNDLKEGPNRGLVWDLDEALHKISFYPDVLCLTTGEFEGEPFHLFDWEKFVVGSLFGWKHKDGRRRFRKAYIETGKGSGKSPLASGIGINMLCADGEPRAQVYAAAYNQEQTDVVFAPAVAMVEQSPALGTRLHLSGGEKKTNISHPKSGSFFRPISSERRGRGKSGPIPHCVLIDEIHEHPTNAMVEFLSAGIKHRRKPLVMMITNSGADRHTVCWDYHQFAVQIAAGILEDDSFFSYVCALDEGDDPFEDETCWPKANPSLPVIPGYDYIRQQVSEAKGIPSKQTIIKRLNFCQWVDAADAWIAEEVWKPAQDPDLDLDDFAGMECFGGLDMSLSSDLTAFFLLFPTKHRHWAGFSWFWMPGDRLLELEQRDNMAPRYQQWRDDGHLIAPPGRKIIDYAHVADVIADIASRFNLRGIVYDRAKIENLRVEFDQIGFEVPLWEHGQGFYKAKDTGMWMPESIAQTEAALTEGRLKIKPNPVLNWNVASTVCQPSTIEPADRYFSKRKATGRIDGSVAMVQSIGGAVWIENVPEPAPIEYRSGEMFL